MSSLPSQPATDLRTAYRVCDVKPLEGDDLDRYYAQLGEARKSEAMINISTMLDLQGQEFSTILLAGQRGCGKTTELRLLERKLRSQYHVIYLETDQIIDINDLDYTDIYFLVAQYVEFDLRKLGIYLDRLIIKDFEDWLVNNITAEIEQKLENTTEFEKSLSEENLFPSPLFTNLIANLTSQTKIGTKGKKKIHIISENSFSRLKRTTNLLLDDATRKIKESNPNCKGILLIFDNLDRCTPRETNHLFFDYALQLQQLRANVIYTASITALYSTISISNKFNNLFILPMVNIYDFDRNRERLYYNLQGTHALVDLINRRIDTKKIFASKNILFELVHASGGNIRQFLKLVCDACVKAIGNKHTSIQLDDVQYVVKQLQFSFERLIPDTHYEAIAYAYKFKQVPKDDVVDILSNTSVLEYVSEDHWYYPHPTVIQIDAFQRVLKKINLNRTLPKYLHFADNNKLKVPAFC